MSNPESHTLGTFWTMAEVLRSLFVNVNPRVLVAACEMHAQKTPRQPAIFVIVGITGVVKVFPRHGGFPKRGKSRGKVVK
jgi:hypothetical protein